VGRKLLVDLLRDLRLKRQQPEAEADLIIHLRAIVCLENIHQSEVKKLRTLPSRQIMRFRTRSGYQGSPRRLAELRVGAECLRGIAPPRLAYSETSLVRIQRDNVRGVVVAIVGGVLSLR
jgi:hypothetical protein